jgi:hypothetical protein
MAEYFDARSKFVHALNHYQHNNDEARIKFQVAGANVLSQLDAIAIPAPGPVHALIIIKTLFRC